MCSIIYERTLLRDILDGVGRYDRERVSQCYDEPGLHYGQLAGEVWSVQARQVCRQPLVY